MPVEKRAAEIMIWENCILQKYNLAIDDRSDRAVHGLFNDTRDAIIEIDDGR